MARTGSAREVVWTFTFALCLAYVVWYFPRFIVAMGYGTDNLIAEYRPAGIVDYLLLAGVLLALVMGIRTADTTTGEGELRSRFDRLSIFLGRCSMLLIVTLVSVMTFEVVSRYVFEAPTLWANELSLWLASIIFLLSGLYAMQQRSHIRIYLLYDVLPRWLQRVCDAISAALILVFAVVLIWGGFGEAYEKVMRWETYGTAFDPPIPATMKPLVMIVVLLVALQAIVNLIADWRREAETHGVVDETEFEDIITSARSQHEQGDHLTGRKR